MQLSFILCAESAVVDRTTNKLSIYNIIEQVSSPIFPAAVPMTLVAQFTRTKRENDQQKMKLTFSLDNMTKPLGEEQISISFEKKMSSRLIAYIQAVIIPQPGILSAKLEQRNRLLGEWKMNIKKLDEQIQDRKSTRLNSSHIQKSRMPSSA